jgi:hypothetical protein
MRAMQVAEIVGGQPQLTITNQQLVTQIVDSAAAHNYSISNVAVTDLSIELVDDEYWFTYKFTCLFNSGEETFFGSCAMPLNQTGNVLTCEVTGGDRKVTCKGKNCTGCIAKSNGCTACVPPATDPPTTGECTSESSSGGNGSSWATVGSALIAAVTAWLIHCC